MDFRKINSYAILLAIVVVVGLLVSMIARFVILAKGADTGTANLVFIIVMGVCAIFYLTVMAAFSSVADFVVDKILPKITRKNAPAVEAKITEPADHVSDMDIEQIKQEVDKRFFERQKEQIELFRRYAHREVGPYITSDELVRLDRYIEYYALQESGSTELAPIRPQKLKKCRSIPFRMEHGTLFRTTETGGRAMAEIRICSACRFGGFLHQRETLLPADTAIYHSQHSGYSEIYGRTRRLKIT